jgi:hypothetical protein
MWISGSANAVLAKAVASKHTLLIAERQYIFLIQAPPVILGGYGWVGILPCYIPHYGIVTGIYLWSSLEIICTVNN